MTSTDSCRSGPGVDPITTQVHHPYAPPAGFAAFAPAVHKASTVLFPDLATLRGRASTGHQGYSYGLHGTPTTYTLEQRIASLEGGLHCVLVPSGLAAITVVNLALLKSGDEVLLPSNVYGPSREQARALLSGWGIGHRLYDPMDAAALAAMIGAAVILFDPIFQGLAISLMAGEIASLLLSRMAVPVLFYLTNRNSAESGQTK
jgi:cystathionine beta-lyase/cystathionine gamma-synthase